MYGVGTIQNIPCCLVICYTQSWPGHSPYPDLLHDCFDIPLVSHQLPSPIPFWLTHDRIRQRRAHIPLALAEAALLLRKVQLVTRGDTRLFELYAPNAPGCFPLRTAHAAEGPEGEQSLPQGQPQAQASAEERAAGTRSASPELPLLWVLSSSMIL